MTLGMLGFAQNMEALGNLPKGATVGTSSLRRAAFLKHHRPDIKVRTAYVVMCLQGLDKLDKGEVDAIILAVSGLKRIN